MPGLVSRTRFLQATPEAPFATSVHASGRYLLDQFGQPFLMRGCSPWYGLLTHRSPSEIGQFFAVRAAQGFNAAIVTLCPPLSYQGGDGSTFDGLYPFTGQPSTVDVAVQNETFWQRVDAVFTSAENYGITVVAMPADWWGWFIQNGQVGTVWTSQGTTGWQDYGDFLGNRYKTRPNIIWLLGHDYDTGFYTTYNPFFRAMMDGIRAAGDTHLSTYHLVPNNLSRDNSTEIDDVDFDWVYMYTSIYAECLFSYNDTTPVLPLVHGESAYENENNGGELPNLAGPKEIRRQLLWSLTSAACGTFYGHADEWQMTGTPWDSFLSDTDATSQVNALCDWFEANQWWTLIPDQGSVLLTSGQGTDNTAVMTSTWATVCRNTTGSTPATRAIIYFPTNRTFTLDETKIAGTLTGTWVDPSNMATQSATGSGGTYTMPGNNAAGDGDWLLLLEGSG